jgi:hypothetical protein
VTKKSAKTIFTAILFVVSVYLWINEQILFVIPVILGLILISLLFRNQINRFYSKKRRHNPKKRASILKPFLFLISILSQSDNINSQKKIG